MSAHTSELAVRGHERYACNIAALVGVGAVHAKIIRVDKSAPGAGGPAMCHIVDLSTGGAGLRSPLFFPLTTSLVLTITPPEGLGADAVQVAVRVQRVMMLDRAPTYYLGTAFEALPPDKAELISAMLASLKASGAALVPEKPRA